MLIRTKRMTPEEVINELDKIKSGGPCTDYDRRDAAIGAAKAAVRYLAELADKEEPKLRPSPMPEDDFGPYPVFRCPNCDEIIRGYKSFQWCPGCCIQLDWE